MREINIKDVVVGDYIYIIPKNESVKIIKVDNGYNAIDKNGNYSDSYDENIPDTSIKDFNEYISSWCNTWYYPEEISFMRDCK